MSLKDVSPPSSSEILPRRKTMIAILVTMVALMLTAAIAFLLTADRISRTRLEPELNRLAISSLEKELVLAEPATGLPNLAAVQRILDDFTAHPRIESIEISSGDDILLQAPVGLETSLSVNDHDTVRESIFTTDQRTFRIRIHNASSLPLHYLTETISTVLIVSSLGAVILFLLYALIRRWQQLPYEDLKRQLEHIPHQQATPFRFHARDPDLDPLVESLNEFYRQLHRRHDELSKAHQQAENARQRATLLARESARMNDDLAKEVRVRGTMERQLGHTKALLDAILDAIPFALFAIDEHGRILQTNRRGDEWLESDEHALRGYHLLELIPELAGILRQLLLDVASKPYALDNTPLIQQQLTLNSIESGLQTEVTAYALDHSEEAVAVVRIEDIRKRLQMEEMMVQSEKMLTVGGLAAGMAHEINNPLGAILQNLQNIRRRLGSGLPANQRAADEVGLDLEVLERYLKQREIHSLMDHIRDAGERAAAIIASMLNFSRQNAAMLEPHSVASLVQNTVNIARTDLSFKSVSLHTPKLEHLPQVQVIPGEIEQVLVNLIKNALQALAEFKPDADNEAIDNEDTRWQPQINLNAWQEGKFVCLSVEDNGPGIATENIAHVFEPFFTTKQVGQGTGLGLSVSYFIISNHHQGKMEYRPVQPHGAGFVIKLPLTDTAIGNYQ